MDAREPEQPQSTPRELQQRHQELESVTKKYGRQILQEVQRAGVVDAGATRVFQQYRLDGQEFTQEMESGEEVIRWRGLLDPEELALRVEGERALDALCELATGYTNKLDALMRREYGAGLVYPQTPYDVVLGSPQDPERCIRSTLCTARRLPDGRYELTLEGLIQYEKNVHGPYLTMHDASGPQGMAMGSRTGHRIGHQRRRLTMTTYPNDRVTYTLDPEQDTLYLVALNPDALE